MRGQEALISMRMKGFTPRAVFVWVGDDPLRDWSDWQLETPHRAHLQIGDDELLSGLDLRCVAGLLVFAQGRDMARVARLGVMLREAGAARVVAACVAGDDVTVTDTLGISV